MQINISNNEDHDSGSDPPGTAAERAVERSLAGRRATYAAEIERLVEATFQLIRESGEVEPRVSEIVRVAGLSNQAFYRHFRSKHELLVAVLDSGIEQLASYLTHRMAAAPDPVAATREWMRGMAEQALNPEAAAATRPFALARGRLAESHPEEVAQTERRLTEPLRRAIQEASRMGLLEAGDPGARAEALYHLAMGWMQARLLEPDGRHRQSAEQLENFALAGLGAVPAQRDATAGA